ncbi:hypothetical protein KNE206_76610 [Kitasatospora sp. NE20-6]
MHPAGSTGGEHPTARGPCAAVRRICGAHRSGGIATAGAPVALVAGIRPFRFRRLNGVRIGGLAGRLALGTGATATTSYALALPAPVGH